MTASVTTIASFPTPTGDGAAPDGGLFIDSNGNLVGATLGGANGTGATYEIAKTGGSYATTPTFLADLPTGLNTLVGVPNLSADASGDLFGLMLTGGANQLGTVVEFPAGGGAATTLATFSGGPGGSQPAGRLLVDGSGNLFGFTASGGANGAGTVFEIPKTGGVYASTPAVISSFGAGLVPSGASNLVEDAAGDLFGTTSSSVFEVQNMGSGGYAAPLSLGPIPGGAGGIGNLAIDANGDIFGTTVTGGANGDGSVFEIIAGSGAAVTIASFTSADGGLTLNRPKTLIVDANGDLFGTTDPSAQSGGNTGGVVYEIVKTAGVYVSTPTIVVNFNGSGDGMLGANLVADANGNLFGTTRAGGANGSGTAFEITGSGYATPTIVPIISDIFWQNTDSQAAIWQLDGSNKIASAALNPTPGAGWRMVGSGDFNNDGSSDILWQNSSGQAAIWEMNGTTKIAGALVAGDPGTSWRTVGSGDFNGDGKSDILWQNTDGQAAIWEMDGTNKIGSAIIAGDPGTSWRTVGSGDFNGDGKSDILWQNSDGQAAIWEMDGTTKIGSAIIAGDPGPSWKVIGSGDFNGDGKSDILWQNTDGQVAIWNMDGTTKLSGELIANNPGTDWTAVGQSGLGSDILFQNTSGQVQLWEMHANAITGGGAISPNPGTSWHAVTLT